MNKTRVPLVSIITVVFRDCKELEQIIENVSPFRQQGEVELVVIDGGSDDGTRELLERESGRVDAWVSEPDKGIYEAMNKGLRAARGTWVLHVNAGDRLRELPMETLRRAAKAYDIVGCHVDCPVDGFTFVARMNWTFRFQSTLHHQGTFFRRASHCGYDESYRVLGDVDATQRMVRAGARVLLCPVVVSVHVGGGISDQHGGQREWRRIIRENYGWGHAAGYGGFLVVRRAYRGTRKRMRQQGVLRWRAQKRHGASTGAPETGYPAAHAGSRPSGAGWRQVAGRTGVWRFLGSRRGGARRA